MESLVDGDPLDFDVAELIGAPSSLSPSDNDLLRTLSETLGSLSYVGNDESAVGDSIAEISSGTVVVFEGDSSGSVFADTGVDLRVCGLNDSDTSLLSYVGEITNELMNVDEKDDIREDA